MSRPVSTAAERPMRAARAVAAAFVCTVTAALGHLAGGGVIPVEAALAVFVGAALIAWVLAARRVTGGQLVGLLALCQVCVHLGTMMSPSASPMTMSALMVSTHLAATAVSALVLSRGEALVWRLAEHLGLRAVPALGAVHRCHSSRLPAPVHRSQSLTNLLLAHIRFERGPPIAS